MKLSMIGTTLSHYKIIAELGRGGMGIVYKAEDTKLNRTVALKVLPALALSNEDDRVRFLREAQAAAQLNHSHIATVYEIDEAVPEGSSGDDLRPFIAMEFIDGETLTAHVARGPLKIETAIRIAKEVASALQAAHDKNIVHRDVKSGNVMLAEKGKSMVLDFGLAKTAHSTMLTQMGSTLGTVAYMSPEQARSEEVDHRTDLWALGVLIYEMIAGHLPFGGDYEQAIVYSILNEDPAPLTSVRTGVPMEIEQIVGKCLTRDVELRYRSAGDIAVDLARIDVRKSTGKSGTIEPISIATEEEALKKNKEMNWPVVIGAAITGLLLGALGMWLGRGEAATSQGGVQLQLSIDISPYSNMQFPAISREGRFLAFVATDSSEARRLIRVRDMSSGQIETISNSAGARRLSFSPDGRWLLFGTDVDIRKVLIPGGTPSVLVNASFAMATWGLNGSIIYESDGPIRVLEEGATTPRILVAPDTSLGERLLDHPFLFGSTLMYTSVRRSNSSIAFMDLNTGRKEYPLENASQPRYTKSGHLIYNRLFQTEQLMARPYDLDRRLSLGPEVPIVDASLNGLIDFSENGIMVRGSTEILTQRGGFSVVDQSGAALEDLPIQDRVRQHPSLSPDRLKMAITEYESAETTTMASNSRIWLYDVNTWSSIPISSPEFSAVRPIARDKNVYFMQSSEAGLPTGFFISPTSADECSILRVPRNGPYDPDFLVDSVYCQSSFDVAVDESSIVYVKQGDDESVPISVTVRGIESESEIEVWSGPVLRASVRLAFNPSANFVAINAPTASRYQTFVMTAEGAGPWVVSDAQVDAINWSEDAGRIYYASGRSLYQASVSTNEGFRTLDSPAVMFTRSAAISGFSVQPEQNAIYLTDLGDRVGSDNSGNKIFVTINWFDELRTKAPASTN